MLPDLLCDNLKLVFCGTASGKTSAKVKHYYARPGNKFWRVLYEVELTPLQLSPVDFPKLLEYGIGLTDLAKNVSGMDHILETSDFDIEGFIRKIKHFQPRMICFNGKRAAQEYFGKKVVFGLQADLIGMTKIFVAPSTSGTANRSWDFEIWRELARYC